VEIQAEIESYSSTNGYAATSFHDLRCTCVVDRFRLYSDDEEGGAFVVCVACACEIDVCDSRQYIENKSHNICSCGGEELQVTVGQALHSGTSDARWTYVGAKCLACGLAGVYVDWLER
jgi:hypothetical protein